MRGASTETPNWTGSAALCRSLVLSPPRSCPLRTSHCAATAAGAPAGCCWPFRSCACSCPIFIFFSSQRVSKSFKWFCVRFLQQVGSSSQRARNRQITHMLRGGERLQLQPVDIRWPCTLCKAGTGHSRHEQGAEGQTTFRRRCTADVSRRWFWPRPDPAQSTVPPPVSASRAGKKRFTSPLQPKAGGIA